MSKSLDHHCSDDTLLCYLDRELDADERSRVEEHLSACWLCRSNLSALDRTAQDVAGLLASALRSSDRSSRARERFLVQAARLDKQRITAPPTFRKLPHQWSGTLSWAFAATIFIAVGGYTLTHRRPESPAVSPERVVTAAAQAEHRGLSAGIAAHQVFSWEINTLQPARQARRGRIEIWSDRSGRRYSSRLFHEYGAPVTIGNSGSGDSKLLFPAALIQESVELGADVLERRVTSWLHGRPRAALFLADEFADFCRSFGMQMKVERLDATIRISAVRQVNGVSAEFALVIDATTFVPLRQTLRLSDGPKVVEVRLAAKSSRALSTIDLAVFEPPRRVSVPESVVVPPVAATGGTSSAHEATQNTSAESLLGVLYQLHRQGICRDDSVTISRNDSGQPRIRILVHSEERKASILDSLAPLGIDTEVQTLSGPEWNRPGAKVSLDAPIPRAAAQHALSVSEALFGEAWALLQIAELPEAVEAGRSHVVLARMVRDHLAALQRLSGEMRGTFSGVLPPSEATREFASLEDSNAEWQASAVRLYRAAARVRDGCNHLIAEDHPSPGPVRQAVNELNLSLDTLSRTVRDFDLVFARDFENKEVNARKD